MDSIRLFRILLVASALFAAAGAAISAFELYETSEDLEIVLMWNGYGGVAPFDASEVTGTFEIAVLIAFVILMVAMLAGYIAALFFKNWGRVLLAATTFVSILATPAFGLFVTLPVEMMFYELSGATFYIALTMTFFTPLNNKFEKPKI